MRLVIISGAARAPQASNTAKIVQAFRQGYAETGDDAQVWYLADRRQWAGAKAAFERSELIMFALPLYVENIPGIMLEFLQQLTPKQTPGTKIAFLLQGGFPEASQSRCCERYLEMLPEMLGCTYAGTLLKGDMFGLSLTDEESRRKMLAPYIEMGRYFAQTQRFDKETANRFAGPEFMSAKEARMFRLFGHLVQRIFMGRMAKKMGCVERLDAKPY